MAVVWLLTRDYRTDDNLTAQYAYELAAQNGEKVAPVFFCNPEQLDPQKNIFHNSNAIQFISESLEMLSKEINMTVIKSYDELSSLVRLLKISALCLAKDFTPFAAERVQKITDALKGVDIFEIHDITLKPPESVDKSIRKLSPFINYYATDLVVPSKFRLLKQHTISLPGFPTDPSVILKKYYTPNPNLAVHPGELQSLLDKFGDNIRDYGKKTVREKVKKPKVSKLSAFVKFGLISIRKLYQLPTLYEGLTQDDIDAFQREVMFRDFFYYLAYQDPDGVYSKYNWSHSGTEPKFCYAADLIEYRKYKGEANPKITPSEQKELDANKQIYENWTYGESPYDVVNLGMKQLVETGYMPNRLRMICTSYLTRESGLWWRYAEMIFAINLTDYDWTINCLNHQNLARTGLYPKYTQDFSIQRQENNFNKEK